jgi:peptidyl-prolyl cis-trans isomerase C
LVLCGEIIVGIVACDPAHFGFHAGRPLSLRKNRSDAILIISSKDVLSFCFWTIPRRICGESKCVQLERGQGHATERGGGRICGVPIELLGNEKENNNMGNSSTSVFLIMAIALVFAGFSFEAFAEKPPSQVVLAKVNGTAITQEDLNREMENARARLEKFGGPKEGFNLEDMKKEVLENLIKRELLYQKSQEEGIVIDKAALDEKIEPVKKQFSSEEEFRAALKVRGLSEEDLRLQVQKGLATKQLLDKEVIDKITVPEDEIRAYFDENPDFFTQPERFHARHILVTVEKDWDDAKKAEARKKIEDIEARLKKGEDFAALAREYSDCPSKEKGGDLGYVSRGQMVKPFEDAVFSMKPGERSGIVETRFGFHIIEVLDIKPPAPVPYDSIKGRIEEFLKRQKSEQALEIYVDGLTEKAKIERFLDESS